MPEKQQLLKITVHSAIGLITADARGKSDPYCKFWWRNEKYKTAVIRNTVTPEWKKTFTVPYQRGKDSRVLHLEIWDQDTFGNDPLGKVDLDLATLQPGVSDSWYPIQKLAGVGKGQLRVIVESPGASTQIGSPAAAQNPYHCPPAGIQPPMLEGVFQACANQAAGNPYPPQQFNPYMHPQMSGGVGGPSNQQQFPYPYQQFPPSNQQLPPTNQQFDHANQHPSNSPGYQHMNLYPPGGMPPQVHYGFVAPGYGMPTPPSPSDMPQHDVPLADTRTVVDEIKRILPKETVEDIKAALGRFDGDKEKALNHLINHQVSLAIQQQSHHKPPPSSPGVPALGKYGQELKPTHYTAIYDPQGAAVPQYVGHQGLGLKPAPQYIADPMAVYSGQGRKKALLIGINYFGTPRALRGCIHDVHRMKQMLIGLYGFPDIPDAIVMLTDDNTDWRFQPTRKNILYAMRWLVQDAKQGDVFFFHFSGHGAQKPNLDGTEEDGYDETILPSDFTTSGVIVDDEMHSLLVQPLPSGVRLTAVMDCCHSGTGLELTYKYSLKKNKWKEEYCPIYTQGDVQLFSSCEDGQSASDQTGPCSLGAYGESGGVMTTALISILATNPWGHTYPSLLSSLQQAIAARGCSNQCPQLTSSQMFSINRRFNLTDIVPNHNEMLGRHFKKSKKEKAIKKKKKGFHGGAGLMGGAAGLAGGFLLAGLLS